MFALVATTAALLPACLILAGHWFPWPLLLGRQLHRLEAYLYGVSCIMLPATALALYLPSAREVLAVFWIAAGAAGLATLTAWGVDRLIAYIHSLRDQVDEAQHANDK
jgi:hypothetical protein